VPPKVVKVGVNYNFKPTAADPDSDPLSFSIRNQPDWANFNSGSGQLQGVASAGSEGSYNDIAITVSDGAMSAALPTFSITVEPAASSNMPPEINGIPPATGQVGSQYSFTPSASDPDGDGLLFSIVNPPGWASFNPVTGQLSGVPQQGFEGQYPNIVISVSDAQTATSLPAFSITVEALPAANHAPEISGTPAASVTIGNSYSFTPTASDADADRLTFSIVNKPVWAGFNVDTGELSGAPLAGLEGQYANIAISVSDAQTTASLPPFSITVEAPTPGNTAPVIGGTPATSVTVGDTYSFMPAASDPEGDTLIFTIRNRPAWASFDSGTGALSGTPVEGDVGTAGNIRIGVNDGELAARLPAFSIAVISSNSAPIISGVPASSVVVGANYAFTPTGSDPDGDPLSFSIVNKPGWASFSSATGALSGVPTGTDAGDYTGISITVDDGQLSATLAPFMITVTPIVLGSATLSWTPPTQNNDGSPLTDLAGYRIYYGLTEANYPNSVSVDNPGLTTFVVEGLSPDTYYFVATSITTAGVESDYSNEVIKIVN